VLLKVFIKSFIFSCCSQNERRLSSLENVLQLDIFNSVFHIWRIDLAIFGLIFKIHYYYVIFNGSFSNNS